MAEPGTAEAAMAAGNQDAIVDELGDVLFTVVNLSRHVRADGEQALRGATHKFERRFRAMEALAAADDTTLAALDIDRLEALWHAAKRGEG